MKPEKIHFKNLHLLILWKPWIVWYWGSYLQCSAACGSVYHAPDVYCRQILQAPRRTAGPWRVHWSPFLSQEAELFLDRGLPTPAVATSPYVVWSVPWTKGSTLKARYVEIHKPLSLLGYLLEQSPGGVILFVFSHMTLLPISFTVFGELSLNAMA